MSGRTRTFNRRRAPSHDRWLLSYADFVTLLLAVFMVLFAYSQKSKQSLRAVSTAIHSGFEQLSITSSEPPPAIASSNRTGKPNAGVPRFDAHRLTDQLKGILGEEISRREIVVQQTPEGLVISLRELGFFHSGEATLLPGAADKLTRTAQVLLQQGLEIRVEGHSDDQPIHNATFQSNWQLSTARAMSVLSLLVEKGDFAPDRISVAGYGPYRPVADNATPEGRQMNRRVDLVIIAPKSSLQP